jgi:hypothetical protein
MICGATLMTEMRATISWVNRQTQLLAIAAVFLTLPSTGCATIFSKSQYPVAIVNSAGPTHYCVVDKSHEVVQQGVTPGKVSLPAKRFAFLPAKYTVVFAGENAATQQRQIAASLDPWTAGNILIGGIPGIAIDGITGAMYKLPEEVRGDVPSHYAVVDPARGQSLVQASLRPLSGAPASSTESEATIIATRPTAGESGVAPVSATISGGSTRSAMR